MNKTTSVEMVILVEITQCQSRGLWYKNKIGNRYYVSATPYGGIYSKSYKTILDVRGQESRNYYIFESDFRVIKNDIELESTYKIIAPKTKKYKLVIHDAYNNKFHISEGYYRDVEEYCWCDTRNYTPISIIYESMIEE